MTSDALAAGTADRGGTSDVGPMADATATFETIDEVLAIFRPVMRAMAAAGGSGCEVVLHDLSSSSPDLDHTIVAIENGHVTGRTVGGPSTSLGVGVLHDQQADHDAFGYQGFTPDGRRLRCSSVYFRNAAGRIIAALCINLDLSVLQRVRTLLDELLPAAPDQPDQPSELFGRDLVGVMDAMISRAIDDVGRPVDRMSRADRVAVLARLDQQGVLQMRKGVETVASRLHISRVTAYAYLEEARQHDDAAR